MHGLLSGKFNPDAGGETENPKKCPKGKFRAKWEAGTYLIARQRIFAGDAAPAGQTNNALPLR